MEMRWKSVKRKTGVAAYGGMGGGFYKWTPGYMYCVRTGQHFDSHRLPAAGRSREISALNLSSKSSSRGKSGEAHR